MRKGVLYLITIPVSILFINLVLAFPIKPERYIGEPVSKDEKQWVDSIMKKLTPRDRIAQLFMVAAYSNQSQKHIDNITALVKEQKIGGLVFFQGSPVKQAELTNRYQKLAKIPLLIGMDAEWGVSMRLDSVISFPRQMTLGAITDNNLVYELGVEMARQCKLLGVHINFTPSVDVNCNPNNPVINTRSFGENQYNVADKGIAIMRGLQDNGVIACAKHFPGHGDTNTDSHHELPIIPYSKERLDTLELYPFKQLIENGIASIMIGHLYLSSIDTRDEKPASLSERIIRSILKRELNFDGLIITDALNMSAVKTTDGENLAVAVIKAGNDVLLMPTDVAAGINAIETAIKNDELTQSQIDDKCRKILTAKYRAGLNRYKPINLKGLTQKLNNPESKALNNKLIESALTLVVNNSSILPLKELDSKTIAYVEVGKNKGITFENQLELYANITKVSVDKSSTKEQLAAIKKQLASYNTLIVGYHIADSRPARNFGVDTEIMSFISDIANQKQTIFTFFGSPYFLSKTASYQNTFNAIIVAYDNSEYAQNRAAQAIFGAIPFKGKLPVSANTTFTAGYGIETNSAIRLKYVEPEEIGFNATDIRRIDSIINKGIKEKAFPGCQVIAAYKGQVFYHKAIGTQTYDKTSAKVKTDDLYDVASVTKVSATLPLVMKMVDTKKVDIDKPLKTYIKLAPKSDKGTLLVRDILLHQAGLKAFIPFYLTMFTVPNGEELINNKTSTAFSIKIPGTKQYINKNSVLDKNYFSNKSSNVFNMPVANGLYSSAKAQEYVYNVIDTSTLLNRNYRYSDLGFIYLQRIIESVYEKREDYLADAFFYNPLGMNYTTYLPLNKVTKARVAPTEKDDVFRRQLVQGYVHDQAAAVLGGVSGHAGLFSTANDLAKLMQMYLNCGEYGGERYIDSAVVAQFTKYDDKKKSRRGLGFDKPETNPKKASPVCKEASLSSYGHSGFTGALVWVDPERDLIYVFLSNRIYPSTENLKITTLGTRTEILAELLKSIDKLKEAETNQLSK